MPELAPVYVAVGPGVAEAIEAALRQRPSARVRRLAQVGPSVDPAATAARVIAAGTDAHAVVLESEIAAARELVARIGDVLLVVGGSDAADLVDLELPAFVLPVEEQRWLAALARMCRIHEAGAVVTPTPIEHAMMCAAVGAMRSAALRGGVGAALLDECGDVVCVGTAEVPRHGGGQYWDGDPADARDHTRGYDPATQVRQQTVERLLWLLQQSGGSVPTSIPRAAQELLQRFDRAEDAAGVGYGGRLARTFESLGRVVHAEMAVLCQAARCGIAVRGRSMCITSGPCRQCLRHLVCAGLERVVYLGRPVELVPDFLADSVTCTRAPDMLWLDGFEGVAPGAYALAFGRDRRRWAARRPQ